MEATFRYSSAPGAPFDPNRPVIHVDPDAHALKTFSEVGTVSGGITWFRAPTSALLLAAARAVKATAGNVFGIHLLNPNAVPIYVKFFNVAAASVVVGTTVPVHVVMVPANDGTNDGQLMITPGAFPLWNFSAAIAVLATSVRADTTTQTAPSAGLLAEVAYA